MTPVTLEERAAAPEEATSAIPGVRPLPPKTARLQRRLTLIVTILPFAGFVAAVWSLWGTGLTALDAALFLAFYAFSGLGVTIGFHRYFTHQGFEAGPKLRAALAIAGSFAVQGPVIRWVADHRRHHAFADQPGDPHSPHLDEGPGVKGVLKGLWHAHIGWFFDVEQTSARRWAPDLVKDPVMRKIDKLFPLWTLLSFGLPPVIGFAITGTARGALTAFIWGSLARIFFLHHVTWSVNSICHFYGKRPYETTDYSTNNWLLAIVSFGESWHNNHHAFPTSAVHGIQKGQIDLTGGTIRLLQKLRLVRDVKVVTPKQLEAKRTH
ncbi:MAG TPA: acyl-CoA desaturase [Actinomycetota bacterium]|nr:acyl-CoA desaturase [Actinomycetota bacterium]